MTMFYLYLAGFVAFGYAFGSIPFGLLLTRAAGMGDVRKIGSGNIGATNVLRTGSKKVAIATLLADMAKGAVPVFIALKPDWSNLYFAMAAGFGAFIGHIYPIWLNFRGGKGVATYFGVLIAIMWPAALIFAVVWLAMAIIKKISSLSALVACIAVAIGGYLLSGPTMFAYFALLAAMIFYTHRENIARLAKGTESKINLSVKKD